MVREQDSAEAAGNTGGSVVSHLRDWWQRLTELSRLEPDELGRIARDCGLTSQELKDLVACGPAASNLLYERMRALGLTTADVERAAFGLMRELRRTCAFCGDKAVCARDLAARPDDPAWKGYCPNAIDLTSVATAQGGSSG
jgi:hypothetical protein